MLFEFFKKHKLIILAGFLFPIISCHSFTGFKQPAGKMNEAFGGDAGSTINETDAYKVHFTPSSGSSYYYTVTNESDIELEAGGKKVNNRNKSEMGGNL